LRSLERGVDILVATLDRLTDMIERAEVSLAKIKYLGVTSSHVQVPVVYTYNEPKPRL